MFEAWRDAVRTFVRDPRTAEPLRADYATPGAIGEARVRRGKEEDRRFLAERIRTGLLTGLAVTLGIALVVDPFAHPEVLWTLWALKAAIVLLGVVLWRRSRTATRTELVRAVSRTVVAMAILATASAAFAREAWTAIAMCLMTSATCGGLIPWGVRTQAFVGFSLLAIGLSPFFFLEAGVDRSFLVVVATLYTGITVLVANEHERFRRSTWQTLLFFRENMERLRQIAEHINGVLWLGERGAWGESLLYVSPRYDELWQLDRRELQARPDAWLDAVHPEDRDATAAILRDAAAGGEHDCEYRLLQKDGTVRWIHDYGFPIRDVDGTTSRVARLSQDVTAEREALEATRMRELARGAQAAQEEERRRIARELHDELGQALTGIKLRLATLAMVDEEDREAATARAVSACASEIDQAMGSVHAMIHRLHPPILDDIGIVAALRSLVESFAKRTGIACTFDLPSEEPQIPSAALTTLFRVAQESLTNVARHAGASNVEVRLRVENGRIELRVEDDGRGVGDAQPGFGRRGMTERAMLLSGTFQVESRPGQGTVVRLEVPIDSPGVNP